MSLSRAVLLISGSLLISMPSIASQQTDIKLLTPKGNKGINFTLVPHSSQVHASGAKRYFLSEMGNKSQPVKVTASSEGLREQSQNHQYRPLVRNGLLSHTQRQHLNQAQHAGVMPTLNEQIYRSRRETETLFRQLTYRPLHHDKYLRTRQIALNTLMDQLGKPYRWGGASPFSGFDCSGLIYFAYKDHIKRPFPRTAKGMFHLQEATPIRPSELQPGDLVFFQIRQDSVDHVGVYLGNNQFIQSPRTGRDIRISKLSDDYWQDHYVGARRVMTPENIR